MVIFSNTFSTKARSCFLKIITNPISTTMRSNIANILLILGASASLRPLTAGGITPVDTAMVAVSAVLLLLTARTFRRGVVDRREGALFLALYGGYL